MRTKPARRKKPTTTDTFVLKARREIDRIAKARDALRHLLREYEGVLDASHEALALLEEAIEQLSQEV